jgi:hypothetical protein
MMTTADKPAATEPEPVDIVQEFITRLANDPWVDASVKQAAQAAVRRYEPKKPSPANPANPANPAPAASAAR